jgi:AhpD family alkylhydroperoxidase
MRTEGTLPRWPKELLFVTASQEQGCSYCTGGHSRFLVKEFGFSEQSILEMRGGEGDQLTKSQKALVAFVKKMASEPFKAVPADFDALTQLGLDNGVILEALPMAMTAGFLNTLALALHLKNDVPPDILDEYF